MGWTFAKDAPAGGQPAEKLTVPFSNYKTGYFTYDKETNLYFTGRRSPSPVPVVRTDMRPAESPGTREMSVYSTSTLPTPTAWPLAPST